MNKNTDPRWLEWAKELQFIAQAGLTYSRDPFDIERFERIREISAEIMSHQSDLPIEKVKELFCNENPVSKHLNWILVPPSLKTGKYSW